LVLSRGPGHRQANLFATTRSAAVDVEEWQTHIVVHASDPTTFARHKGLPLFDHVSLEAHNSGDSM